MFTSKRWAGTWTFRNHFYREFHGQTGTETIEADDAQAAHAGIRHRGVEKLHLPKDLHGHLDISDLREVK